MDKTAIKNFAIWSRRKLLEDTAQAANLLGISEKEIQPVMRSGNDFYVNVPGQSQAVVLTSIQARQRDGLVARIKRLEKGSTLAEAFNKTIDEIAYTWFNRLIAIRFMEVNDLLPGYVRLLSSVSEGKTEPDMVTDPFNSPLNFTLDEQKTLQELRLQSKSDDIFHIVFFKECNALHEYLPRLFESVADSTELLLRLPVMDKEGVVQRLVHDIPEEDWKDQVQIIGWMYQYYNTEPKKTALDNLDKKKIKINKNTIAPATSLYTPDWIVRYLVENFLGRYWLSGHPDAQLQHQWKYYVPDAEQDETVKEELNKIADSRRRVPIEDISFVDPCMGSGHILSYAFDVFMEIYRSQGVTDKDAVASIVEHNLYGLDIDKRCSQLAYFAVMMKACQYDKRALRHKLNPHVWAVQNSSFFDNDLRNEFADAKTPLRKNLDKVISSMEDADDLGSLIVIPKEIDVDALLDRANEMAESDSFYAYRAEQEIIPFLNVAQVLQMQATVSSTNPPYLLISKANGKISEFVKKSYPEGRTDLYGAFMQRLHKMTKPDGYQAMITMHSWMFISSFEDLRNTLLNEVSIINMAHLGPRAFDEIGGEIVQTTAFVFYCGTISCYKGIYCRLINSNSENGKRLLFISENNRFYTEQEKFKNIPGNIIAYWLSQNFMKNFYGNVISDYYIPKFGMSCGDGKLYIRKWFEVVKNQIGFNCLDEDEFFQYGYKWSVLDKGGSYRKWYGNKEHVILWKNRGFDIKHNKKAAVRSPHLFFHPHVSWTLISTSKFSARFFDHGYILDTASNCIYFREGTDHCAIGYLNSNVANKYLEVLNPTMNFSCGVIGNLPCLNVKQASNSINSKVEKNIQLSKTDWDSFEASWDFQQSPLLPAQKVAASTLVGNCYKAWKEKANTAFAELKNNEEELNRIFIDIYGLQDELTPEESNSDVTIHYIVDTKAEAPKDLQKSPYLLTKKDCVKQLISYAVGCILGRYSLDVPGLAYAGGDWDASKYQTFQPDEDNIVPITDESYFHDDIVEKFENWLCTVYGKETLADNELFIAQALGKNDNPKKVIRDYFLKDFFKDHCKMYQKRPIYWLLDSGKRDGFKALIYMHRYNENTWGQAANKYVTHMTSTYQSRIKECDAVIQARVSADKVAQARKDKEKFMKQLEECRAYFTKISHLAQDYIKIDLDDGVKANYEKVQIDRNGEKVEILAKI